MQDIKYFNFYHYFIGMTFIIMEVVLPLYLAVNGLSFTAVGVLLAAGQVVKIISSIFAKFLQNRNKDVLAVIIFASLFFVSLVIILVVKNSLIIYIFNLVVTFSCQGLQTIIFVKYVKSTVKNGYIYDSIYYRDFFQNTGRATPITIFVLSSLFPLVFETGIISCIFTGIFGVVSVKIVNKNENLQITNNVDAIQQ